MLVFFYKYLRQLKSWFSSWLGGGGGGACSGFFGLNIATNVPLFSKNKSRSGIFVTTKQFCLIKPVTFSKTGYIFS